MQSLAFSSFAEAFVIGLIFTLGAGIASFLNVVVIRWPLIRSKHTEAGVRVSLSYPPSRCNDCLTPIRWHDNIPVIGWIKRRGRCASCQRPFTPRYALYEAAGGSVFVIPSLLAGVTLTSLFLGFCLVIVLYAMPLGRLVRK